MAKLWWIQLSSALSLWISAPLDAKTRLSTDDRLKLTKTQRWLWCLVYDTDVDKWKQLINEDWDDETEEEDWINFWTTFTIWQESFTIDWDDTISLNNTPTTNSEDVYLTWIHLVSWDDYDIDWKDITFKDWCVIDWDSILVKYLVDNG